MQIKRLNYDDKPDAVEILATAFYDYPVMRYVLSDAGNRYPDHIRALVGFYLETRYTRDWPILGLWHNGELQAVAGINAPEALPWPPELHEKYADLGVAIGDAAIERMEAFENECDASEPEEPHYFLGIIGVNPEAQGKGYAGAIIDQLKEMSRLHPTSQGVCLTTQSDANIALYKHLGFRLIDETRVGELHSRCL
jgi:GNAT superfamily N-acetyltransferase